MYKQGIYIKGENICKITREKCIQKTICKFCKIAIEYRNKKNDKLR